MKCGRRCRFCRTRGLPSQSGAVCRSTPAISQTAEARGAERYKSRMIWRRSRWPSPNWDRAGWRRRPKRIRSSQRSSARAHPGRRPAWAIWRCMKAVSRTPCGFSSKAPPRTWRPRTPTKQRRKFTSLAYAHLLRGQKAARDRGRRQGAGEQQSRADPIPGGADLRRGWRNRQSAPAGQPASSSELPAEPQAYGKIIEGEIALKNGDAAAGHQDPDRGQRRSRYLVRSLRSRARVSGGRARFRRPTPSSTAASSAEARRCRCSSTRSPRSAISRPCTTTRAASAKD